MKKLLCMEQGYEILLQIFKYSPAIQTIALDYLIVFMCQVVQLRVSSCVPLMVTSQV